MPAVAVCTESFAPLAQSIAKALGIPNVVVVIVPHPVAGRGDEWLRELAAKVAEQVTAGLLQAPQTLEAQPAGR